MQISDNLQAFFWNFSTINILGFSVISSKVLLISATAIFLSHDAQGNHALPSSRVRLTEKDINQLNKKLRNSKKE
jgi:hypothetical protein